MKKCACGKEFKQYSTIQNKCPNCNLKALRQQKSEKQVKGTFIIQKFTTSNKKRILTPLQKEKAKAWKWFSRYIRLKYSYNGVCKCITCGQFHGIKNMDAGHFLSRRFLSTLFDEDNCRPQCLKCNRYQQGRSYEFEVALISEIGIEKVNELKAKAKEYQPESIDLYQEISEKYHKKVNEMQKFFKVKYW